MFCLASRASCPAPVLCRLKGGRRRQAIVPRYDLLRLGRGRAKGMRRALDGAGPSAECGRGTLRNGCAGVTGMRVRAGWRGRRKRHGRVLLDWRVLPQGSASHLRVTEGMGGRTRPSASARIEQAVSGRGGGGPYGGGTDHSARLVLLDNDDDLRKDRKGREDLYCFGGDGCCNIVNTDINWS